MEELKLHKRKKKAEKDNNKQVIISTCADLAEIYIKRGDFNSAVKEYQNIANIYKSENNFIEYARANRGIGEAYMGLHDFEQALQHFKTYLDIASEEECELEKQRAFATMGHAYLTWYLETQNNPETNLNLAYKYFMKSLVIAENLTGINKLEKADMTARLFSNLGLVKESLGEYDLALNLFERSITICKQNDIYEQLSRGLQSIASLYDKKGDYNKTIQYYNLAVDAAKKLRSNVLICSALQAKADILIKLSDFHGAKQVLLTAYKLKIPNIQEREHIEDNLRTVAAMCYTEDKLVVSSGDNKEMKKLYEVMGDAACQLKNFSKAIEYYKLMLEYAQKSGINDQDLASCYYSIAETYKDNEQYEEAVEYFEKELSLYSKLQDCLNTLSKIADTKETGGKPVEEVKSVYEVTFARCRQEKNLKEEKRMVHRCIDYLRRNGQHSDAFHLEQYLDSLGSPMSDSESSSDQESESTEFKTVIDKINLSEITDNSEDSDIENETSQVKSESAVGRRRHRSFAVKKNAKGESQLHVACINGNLKVVTHLLEQGHPVNIRDNSGWLPLHEACNHGYYDIVKALLDKGAFINDRGGTHCNGVTPLYDAANNGHIKIVELLLDEGASPLARTDDGDTALQVFKEWHRKNPFAGADLLLYNSLVKRMTETMERAGQKVQPNTSFRKTRSFEHINSEPVWDDINVEQNISNKRSFIKATQEKYKSRKFIDQGRNDSIFADSTSNEISSDEESVGEYQQLMNILKRKPIDTNINRQRTIETKSAFITPHEELLDDWLEDDLAAGKPSKKRKINPSNSLVDEITALTGTSRSSSSPSKKTSTAKRASDDFIIPNDFFNDEFENETAILKIKTPEKKSKSLEQPKKIKRANQASLLDAGFSRRRSDTPPAPEITSNKNTLFRSNTSFEVEKHKQQKLTSFGLSRTYTEPDSTTQGNQDTEEPVVLTPEATQYNIPSTGEMMVFVDINIDTKVFRIPVMLTQVQTNTIGWLAEQAAYKYARKEGTKPTLELETTSGALLSDEDPLSLLFPFGVVQAEPIVGRIVQLSLPSIVDRYKEACMQTDTDPDENLCAKLEEMSISLNLNNCGFLGKSLSPLCKALNHQTPLFELDLSGNLIDTNCVKKLCVALPSLINLNSLNLRCTGLTCSHIVDLVNMFTSSPFPILQNLTSLNLSDNYLENKSLYHLSQITKHITLTNLFLSNVKFTRNIFREPCNENISLQLENLHHFDISDNQLDASSINRFLQWTNSCKIKELHIDRNSLDCEGVMGDLVEWLKKNEGGGPLEHFSLSRCAVQEKELYELLGLNQLKSLKNINLSYNSNLTGISLRRLLEYSTLQRIILIGCDNILKYFDDDWENCELLLNETTSNKFLEISGNLEEYSDQAKTLLKVFESAYPECYIEQDSRFLLLSSKSFNRTETR